MPHPALAQHLYAIIGFMRVATSWKQFKEIVQKGFSQTRVRHYSCLWRGLRGEQLAAHFGEAAITEQIK